MLLCTVRNCALPLRRDGRRLVCPQGHSFDVARSGYINLLQPQDRRSKHPGDTQEAIAARRRLHDRGITQPILAAVREMLSPGPEDIVLDVGCGEGFYPGSLARETGCSAHGVDISIAAIGLAARRYPQSQWVVANADRFLPFADRSFSLVLSITGRLNAAEFRRVLREGGTLLVAVPAPGDLIELRGPGRDRAEGAIESCAPAFQLTRRSRVTTTADVDASAVSDVLHAIYRPMRAKPAEPRRLTFSLDLLCLQPR